MDMQEREPDKPLSPFEKFVRAIAGVPRDEIREAEKPVKRGATPASKSKHKSA